MLQIKEYPHRATSSYYRDFDTSFDPEPSPVYVPKKTVEWWIGFLAEKRPAWICDNILHVTTNHSLLFEDFDWAALEYAVLYSWPTAGADPKIRNVDNVSSLTL